MKKLLLVIVCFGMVSGMAFSQSSKKQTSLSKKIPYTTYDRRPLLSCDSYSPAQKKSLQKEFDKKLKQAKSKRDKTVAAATFLVELEYSIPYAYEWNIPEPGYELVARYPRKGLFLNDITEMAKGVNNTYPAWGCPVPTHERYPRKTVQGLGDSYENGFHCSSFVGWALRNGDAITDTTVLYQTHANKYRVFPGTREIPLKNAVDSNLIRPGDLLWFKGHIAMVIALEGDYVIFASGEGGDKHDATRGVRWRAFNKKTTNYSKFQYSSIIEMKNVYGD